MKSHSPLSRFFVVFVGLALLVPVLSGCDLAKNQLKPDRSGNMEIQDYRDAFAPRLPEVEKDKAVSDASIPELAPYVASPSTNMKSMPLVSISVNQSVPLRDVLFELAQQADYDLELDPRITGSIIFTARQRPLDEVVERIAKISDLRFNFENDVMRVELDTPYNKIYKVDYLSFIRKTNGKVSNNISVVAGEGTDTGSQFQASSESEADFWGELEQNLSQLLGGSVSGALKTSRTPRITATAQNPNVQPVAPTAPDAAGNVQVSAPQANLQVDSLPVEEEEQAPGSDSAEGDDNGATFTINKQAGIINVYANEKGHKLVENYLKILRKAVTSQVLIEAKVLEVQLNDEFQTGIDWRLLDGGDLIAGFSSTASNSALNALSAANLAINPSTLVAAPASVPGADMRFATGKSLVLGAAGNDLDALIRAVSGFGTVKALASPRLTVINNQSAVLNVATNQVFFDVDIDVTTEDGVAQVDISSDAKSVPEGVLVNVQPSINLDNNTISMSVRPTITRIVGTQADPAVQYITASADPPITGVESLVPELNVQEIDSVIQVRSGQAVIMGGLLQDRSVVSQTGIPGLSEAPVLGALFRNNTNIVTKTELVIFLKATILEAPEDSISDTDKDFYRTFSEDRRPMKL
jgi:general secretion pathway protein D